MLGGGGAQWPTGWAGDWLNGGAWHRSCLPGLRVWGLGSGLLDVPRSAGRRWMGVARWAGGGFALWVPSPTYPLLQPHQL